MEVFRLKLIGRLGKRPLRSKTGLQLCLYKSLKTVQVCFRSCREGFIAYLRSQGAQREKIFRWIAAPNSTSSHTNARKKCYSVTGQWLLNGSAYSSWSQSPNSFLWIHGIRESFLILSSQCLTQAPPNLSASRERKDNTVVSFYPCFCNATIKVLAP